MDDSKRDALIERLSRQAEPQLVPIRDFFDGNDDMGSIGCNLVEHPGVATFRSILEGLMNRPDVDAVYAEINELDPGPGSWPFADSVFIVGDISSDTLARLLQPLGPDEVGPVADVPQGIAARHPGPVQSAWWD